MRYTTLDLAKEAVRRRLALLKEALDRVGQLRKTARKAPDSPSQPATEKKRSKRPAASTERPFHFCLSFAGEDRKYAQALHRLLTKRGMRVFYDNAEKHDLWGRNLYEHLADIYEHRAHFCVMFASRHYVEKAWTGLEREFAQARAFKQPDYILPVRIDDTPVPGLAPTKGYLDVRENTLPEIANTAVRLLAERRPGLVPPPPVSQYPRRRPSPNTGKKTGRLPRTAPAFALLGNHIYEAARYRETDDVITLHLRPRSGEEEARLRTLRDPRGPAWGSTLAFAYRLDGANVSVQDVTHEGEGDRAVAVVTLRPERSPRQRIFIGQDDRALAERAARFIVFAEEPQSRESWTLPLYGRDRDVQFRAGLLLTLWRTWAGTKGTFLAAARLLLVYHLKTLGVVEHITTLEVGPSKGDRLPITLRGYRQAPYGEGRTEVNVEGEITLSRAERQT
ncbi:MULTISPECIES: TIR domain-containing protein [Deinococcus]|nr:MULTISPECIES: TIR domain-containing protein [Deinococcus]